jgi:hypothetical protein
MTTVAASSVLTPARGCDPGHEWLALTGRGCLEAALVYARCGWAVLPLHTGTDGRCSCGRAACRSPGRHPRTPHGVRDATRDAATIRRWWRRWPGADVGLATGAVSGLVAVALDPSQLGLMQWEALQAQYGAAPETLQIGNGLGRPLLLFAHPRRDRLLDSLPALAGCPGVAVIADGGCIPAPPSQGPRGHCVRWRTAHDPRRCPPAPLPAWLLAELAAASGPLVEYSLAQALALDFSEPRWAIPGLLPEGLTVLAGAPKIGKSWLLLDWALAVASGWPALGGLPVERGAVLYAALEDTPRHIKGRTTRLLGGRAFPVGRITVRHQLPSGTTALADALADALRTHPRTRLVMLDTLAKVRPPRRSRDWYAHDYALGGALQQLAHEFRVALVVSTHLTKRQAADPLDQVCGSIGVTASADTTLILRRKRWQAEGTLLITGRDTEERELALRFDGAQWTRLGPAAAITLSPERAAVLDLLRTAAGPLAIRDVAATLDKEYDAAKKLLWTMGRDGQVQRVAPGQYALPPGALTD